MTRQIQREGGQSVSRLGELDHSLLAKIPFLASFLPQWALPRPRTIALNLAVIKGGCYTYR